MKLKSWHLALLGVVFFSIDDYNLVTDFIACKGFCSEDDFSATLIAGFIILCFLSIFVLSFKYKKTRKVAALLNLLFGFCGVLLFVTLLPMDPISALSFPYAEFLSSVLFLSAGIFYFFKEKEAEISDAGRKSSLDV